MFAFFPLGFGLGGPAFFWTWPIVFVCQFCVCLVFAELSGKFPVAGAIYQWSRRLAGNAVGWFAGWFMLIGYIVSIAALAIAMQTVLPPIWSGFQIIDGDMDPLSVTGAENGIILGSITIVLCTIISAAGRAFMGRITVTGVTIEIIGVFLIIGAMFLNAERNPVAAVANAGEHGTGLGYLPAFLASMLMAAYVMYGFDSAAELSEETRDPRKTAPKAIVNALLVSFVGGGLMIIAALMSAPVPRRRPGHRRHGLDHREPARHLAGQDAAGPRRGRDVLGDAGHPGLGVAGDVLDGPRQPAAVRQVPVQGQQAHRHPGHHRHRGQHAGHPGAAGQHRSVQRVRRHRLGVRSSSSTSPT